MVIAGKTILIVEDEFIVAAMLSDVLEDVGASVVGPAPSVAEALEMAGQGSIDCAVLDWNLGGESGAPVARAMIAQGIPFVIATGYGGVEAEFAGITVLPKPYSSARLIDALKALFNP
jgi:CheY-like chemotaxis protein